MSLNRCEFIGNLGADPEIRHLASGGKVANMRVAVTDTWRDKASGERKERTEWVSVVIFSEGLAKVAEAYLHKGSKVYIAGQMQTRRWQDQTGADRYSTEIVLQGHGGQLVMLDPKPSSDDRQDYRGNDPNTASYSGGDDSDLPF